MEIEITTTKKKLSKSIVNQMRQASYAVLQTGKAIGYVINVRSKCHKAVLVKYKDEFYFFPADYKKGDLAVYRKIGKWSSKVGFDSEAECNLWWEFYQRCLKEATQQIYI